MQFDDILDEIGSFGRYQKWVMFLLGLLNVHNGFLFLIPVFLLGIPEHRCAIPGYSNDSYAVQNMYHQEAIAEAVPTTDGAYDKCHLYKPTNVTVYGMHVLDRNVSLDMSNRTMVRCNKWVYDKSVYEKTFVSKMDLVCDKEIMVANAGMTFFLGMLFGSLVGGFLSDRFGRKTVLLSTLLLNAVASTLNAWSYSYAMFMVLQVVKGGTIIVGYISSYILAMELTGRDKRVWPATITCQAYAVGCLVLSGIAYGLRDWFWIQLVTAMPGFIFLIYWWLLPESPRWLLTRHRTEEAKLIILKATEWNHTRLPQGMLDDEILISDVGSSKSAGCLALFATKTLVLRSLLIFFL